MQFLGGTPSVPRGRGGGRNQIGVVGLNSAFLSRLTNNEVDYFEP